MHWILKPVFLDKNITSKFLEVVVSESESMFIRIPFCFMQLLSVIVLQTCKYLNASYHQCVSCIIPCMSIRSCV